MSDSGMRMVTKNNRQLAMMKAHRLDGPARKGCGVATAEQAEEQVEGEEQSD
eukprot:gene31714-22916_t